MKNLISFLLILVSCFVHAQVANDDCAGTINLGNAPVCTDIVYSNDGATASNIGDNNNPECFTDEPASDVWFSFIAGAEITNYVVEISGVDENGNALSNIQAALYRGFCPDNVFALNTCASGVFGENNLSFQISDLTPNDLYYIRVDNAGGAAFAGDFNICVNEADSEYTIDQEGSTECSGVLYDTGGPNGNYGDDEEHVFTICPGAVNQCIEFNLEYYNIEDGFDIMTFYNGDNTDAPVIAEISAFDFTSIEGDGAVCRTIYAENCLTIEFTSDNEVNAEGFKATWQCSNSQCDLPAAVQIDTAVNDKSIINNLSSALVDITVNSIECENGAIAVFRNGAETDLGLNNGILLTTGDASLSTGPNVEPDNSFSHILQGDDDLDILSQLFGSDLLSNDACVVEVEAFVNSPELNFQFLFGSEEYPEFAGSEFNDIFALFIEGPGIVGQTELGGKKNLALLPNTETPIEINNVNGTTNWEYFRNNEQGISSEYDGFVVDFLGSQKSLTATAQVIPCNTYKLKFAIADRNDFIYDSGVFISELTNSVPELTLASSTGFDYLLEKCSDGQELVVLQLTNAQEMDLKFVPTISGTASSGSDYNMNLPDTIILEAGQTLLTFPIEVLSDNVTEGTETIEILLQNDFGCGTIDVTTLEIEIREEIEVIAQGGLETVYICKGLDFQLFAEGATDYVWTPAGNLSDANISNPIFINPQQQQTFTVTGTVPPSTDSECMGSDMVTVIPIDPELSIFTNDVLEICQGQSVNVELINNAGNQGLSWENPEWGVLSPDSNFTEIRPTFFSDEPIAYVATLSLNGCSVTDTLRILVDAFAFPEILVQDSLACEGQQILLASEAGIGSEFTNYQWTPSDYLSSDTIANPTAIVTEDITYKLVAESLMGTCSDSIEIDITVQENFLELNLTDTVDMCLGDSIFLTTVGTSNGLNITWEPSESADFPDSFQVTMKPIVSGYAIATMDFNGCTATDSVWMQVDSLPSMEFELIQDKEEYCIGEVITIVSPGYEDEDFPNIMFQWDQAPGIVSELDVWNLAIVAADTATFRRITTNGVCRDTIEREIFVLDPQVEIMVADTSILCPFTPVQLTLTSEAEIEELMWEPGMPDLSCDDCENPIATVGTTTTFTASMMADGCPVSASATVNVADLFLAIGFATPIICPGMPVQASLQSNGVITNIDWSPNNVVSCDDCDNPIITIDESTVIQVTADVDGCEISGQSQLTVDETVRNSEIVITPGQVVPVGGEITLTAIPQPSFGPGTTYEWFIDGTSQGEQGQVFNTTQDIEGQTEYSVFIVDENGCFWQAVINVIGSVPTFEMPNAFTPFNGDEVNQVFRLVQTDVGMLDNWEVINFNVYNRWGENVFSCQEKICALENGWDGRINSNRAPAGVYIYAVEIELGNGDKRSYRGDVTLLY